MTNPDMILVPREPTEEMLRSGGPMFDANIYMGGASARGKEKAAQCYRAMIDAAPAQPGKVVGDHFLLALAVISTMSPNYSQEHGFEDHSSLVQRMKKVALDAIAAPLPSPRADVVTPDADPLRRALGLIAEGRVVNPAGFASAALREEQSR